MAEVLFEMIDWQRVDILREEIGEDGFADVVELFLEEVESVVARLIENPDPARYDRDLHFLKGSAWNLGFAAFGGLCQAGEKMASSGNAASVDLAPILECYANSKTQFLAGAADHGIVLTAA